MREFLKSSEIIDYDDPAIIELARDLTHGTDDPVRAARRCFEWVRDSVLHSLDHGMNPVTLKASDVLKHRTGFCYSKSHLLAALQRSFGLPCGFCYQRLSVGDDGSAPFCLHGLNAVYLPDFGWYRMDARGNRPGIDARFDPPVERLAFPVRAKGEALFPEIWPDPLPAVVESLARYSDYRDLAANLPDVCMIS